MFSPFKNEWYLRKMPAGCLFEEDGGNVSVDVTPSDAPAACKYTSDHGLVFQQQQQAAQEASRLA